MLSADLGADLDLHQRLGQHPDTLAQEVDVAGLGLAHKLQQLHLGHGHHVAPLDVLIEPFTSRTYAVATLVFSLSGLLLHHFLGRYCRVRSGQTQLIQRSIVAHARRWQGSDGLVEEFRELITKERTGRHEPDHSPFWAHPAISVDDAPPEVAVVLKAQGSTFPACLWPWCDPEDGQPRKEPLHSNPDASLTKPAVQTNPPLLQAERLRRELDAIVLFQGE
jgi:hypothetical protein